MKLRAILFGVITLVLGLASCDDSLDSVGLGIQPDEDKINVFSDTISFEARTVKMDSLYAKTIEGLLGELHDPVYGNLKAGYICQFYAPEKYVFPDTVIDNTIDSVMIRIFYRSWTGDSLTPMELSVFPVVKALDKHYYTNMDPAKYCDLTTSWGTQGYTARNMTISDSIYNANTYKYISVMLPTSIGYDFLNESRKPQPNAFTTLDAFTDYFKGVYLKTTYGSGNIIQVDYTDMYVFYRSIFTTTDVDGEDSTYVATTKTSFNVTKEVIQLNSYANNADEELLVPNDEKTYIKTPAGIFTELTIPIPEIKKRVGDHKFNNAGLSLSAYGQEDWQYAMSLPSNMILIKTDSVKTFFENQKLPDSKTVFSTTLSSYTYNFGNISNLIQNAIENNPDEDLKLLMMPVTYSSYYDSNYQTYYNYATANYLKPSGVTLKKSPDKLKMVITSSTTNIKK